MEYPGENETQAPQLIASATLLWVLAAGLVGLRSYIRTKIVKVFGAEDWTLLAALVCSLGHSICLIILTTLDYGKHTRWVRPETFVPSQKVIFAMQCCYMVSLALTKISILVLYLRIFTYHYARWITWAILVITIVYNIAGFAVQMTTCVPLSKLWEPSEYGNCHSLALAWAFIGMHVATDFIVFIIPIPIVWSMTMSLRQKLLLLVLFSLGFFACAVSLIRTMYLKYVFATSTDPSWDSISMTHWNVVEVNVAIVCACLMTLKPLVSKLWPQLLDPSSSGEGQTDSKEEHSDVSPSGSLGRGARPPRGLDVEERGDL